MRDWLTRQKLGDPRTQIRKTGEEHQRLPPTHLIGEALQELAIEEKNGKLNSPECCPKKHDNRELELQKEGSSLHKSWARSDSLNNGIDFEHRGDDQLVHDRHRDKCC